MLLQDLLYVVLLLTPFVVGFQLEPGIQRVLSTPNSHAQNSRLPSDTAGNPNRATRLEVTSDPNASLFCARDGDKSTAGYAHFTNSDGIEDKHMFWWLFQSRKDPSNAPLVMVHGGGPGNSGIFLPFSGAGPCRLTAGDDGNGTAVPADFSWIDEVNLLAIDHPVGVGFSYGEETSLRNSSERAAWDVDDFLQAFWTKYPDLAKNQFMIASASYGGTYIPNIVNVIHSRNVAATADQYSTRILKMPDAVMIGNGWSDPLGNYRWWTQGNCHDNPIVNSTGCDVAISLIPACLEALQFSYEQPSIEHRAWAHNQCDEAVAKVYEAGGTGRNPYHATQTCNISDVYDCFPEMGWLNTVMSSNEIRHLVGVPDSVEFVYTSQGVATRFITNGDMAQPAYLLLAPAINSGLRVMVYNGNTDGIVPWRSNLSWMKLLKTDYQAAFRSAPDVSWPGIGSIRKVGSGAGTFAFLNINDAGHFVEWDRQDAFREILVKWLRNESLGLDIDTDAALF